MDKEQLQQRIQELEDKVKILETDFSKHQHDGLDGTITLRKNIKLDLDQYLGIGFGLLYSDTAGDIYWRPKSGADVKLN